MTNWIPLRTGLAQPRGHSAGCRRRLDDDWISSAASARGSRHGFGDENAAHLGHRELNAVRRVPAVTDKFIVARVQCHRISTRDLDELCEMHAGPMVMATLDGIRDRETTRRYLEVNTEHWERELDHGGSAA